MSTQPMNPWWSGDPGVSFSTTDISKYLNFQPDVGLHVLPYFNPATTQHINMGYSYNDFATVLKDAMQWKAAGIKFVWVDWYGPDDKWQEQSTQNIKLACEQLGLGFALCPDKGIITWHVPVGMTPTQYMIQRVFPYMLANYTNSPAYKKHPDGKHFLLYNFGFETVVNLDINAVLTAFPQFAMIYQNLNGITRPKAFGVYNWVGLDPKNPEGCIEASLKNFLNNAAKLPAGTLVQANLVWGFDDHNRRLNGDPTQSCWGGLARFANWKNLQTYLNCIDILNASSFKPQMLSFNTWNDHEEDTCFKWGLPPAVAITGVESAGVAVFTLTGNLNSLDSIQIWVDGQLIATIAPTTVVDLDFTKLSLAPGAHTGGIIAIGKTFIQNVVSVGQVATESIVWE